MPRGAISKQPEPYDGVRVDRLDGDRDDACPTRWLVSPFPPTVKRPPITGKRARRREAGERPRHRPASGAHRRSIFTAVASPRSEGSRGRPPQRLPCSRRIRRAWWAAPGTMAGSGVTPELPAWPPTGHPADRSARRRPWLGATECRPRCRPPCTSPSAPGRMGAA